VSKIQKKIKADTERYVNMVAKHQNLKLNRDIELVGFLIEGLTTNWNRYGYYSCPCRLASGDRNKDRDIICPCNYAPPDIKEFGHCYCGLYLSSEFFKTGKSTSSIPERRK
jgi:ferredoxin-thioredoxin reductase catalytic chain